MGTERWTPRRRVEQALHGGHADKVPFTIYGNHFPRCTIERLLRNRGLCVVERRSVLRSYRPNVRTRTETFVEDGRTLIRTWYETPMGTLTTLSQPAGFTSWAREKMFKSPEDYKAILFFIEDEVFEPDYEPFARAQQAYGEDAIFRASVSGEPLQGLISGSFMTMEDFCIQWMDNRDEILKLYQARLEKGRQTYRMVAESPASHANLGGNIVPEIVSPDMFQRYYIPHYNEIAEIFHRHGKLVGTHLDDDCGSLAEAVAESDLDYIEAFTPSPDTDMTLSQARAAWPDKVLWLNFPSSVHVRPDREVEETTVRLLEELPGVDGIIMGITEDIPEDRWQRSCTAIMDGLDRHAREHPDLYSGS